MALLTGHPRYQDVLRLLDSGGAWRALAEIGDDYGAVLSAMDLSAAERQRSPAHFLLERLAAQLGEPLLAEDAAILLEPLSAPAAAAAAELLRPPLPLAVRPLAETNSESVWVPLGGRLLLLCEAQARPEPSFQWRRGREPVPPAAGGDRAQLCLQPFTPADAGLYSCEVRDAAGGVHSAGTVCVMILQSPPRRQGPLELTGGSLSAGGAVSAPGDRPLQLRLSWSGWPPPQLRWQRDDCPLPGVEGDTLTLRPPACVSAAAPGPATARSAELMDGTYVCIATNEVGEVSSEPVTVEVDRRPLIVSQPEPPLPSHPVGRLLELHCAAYCRRPVRAVWRRAEGGGDDLFPAHQVTTETAPDGVVHSRLRLVPDEAEVGVRRIVCVFHAEGNFENSVAHSEPAKVRVVYPACSKMALIIGNSKYNNLHELPEVRQDVSKFSEAMQRLGFGTLVVTNLTTERSRRVVEYFARAAPPGAYLAVLVAGHGFTHQRTDYLAPVDHPDIKTSPGVETVRCLSMDDIERRLQRTDPSLLLLCHDRCRTMSAWAGAAAEAETAAEAAAGPSARNLARLYSTQMGHEAFDDGEFMRCVLQNLRPHVSVQQLCLDTLEAVSRCRPAAARAAQYPIAELSLVARRCLSDPADHTTALDVRLAYTCPLPVENVTCHLEVTWSNYVWGAGAADDRELLLTLRLNDPASRYFVSHVLTASKDLAGKGWQELAHESGDGWPLTSCWRLCGLPAAADGGCSLLLQPAVVLTPRQEADPAPPSRLPLPPVRLQINSLGLHGRAAPAAAPERKLSNQRDGGC